MKGGIPGTELILARFESYHVEERIHFHCLTTVALTNNNWLDITYILTYWQTAHVPCQVGVKVRTGRD